jgi:hypothetical protein
MSAAPVGIYGVLSDDVSERRQEIGVRLSLGASPATVQRLVLGKGMLLYEKLIQEYFAADNAHPGILKSWLLGRLR